MPPVDPTQSGLPVGAFNAQMGSVYEPPPPADQKDYGSYDGLDQSKPEQPKPAPSIASGRDLTGYGPLEGIRWLKDQAGYKFAGMSMQSSNPGFYVRAQQDLMKKIDGFGQNLSVNDAQHVWEEVFQPSFDGLEIKGVTEDYDARGKALLDQIYAPLAHGDTKPKWDQIPRAERETAAAYAIASLFSGRGGFGRAITALNRPLTMQEEENVKKEAERQQNETLRRQNLTQQFNMLLGNEKMEVSAMQDSQRINAQDKRQDAQITAVNARQQAQIDAGEERAYNGDVKALENNFMRFTTDSSKDSRQRLAAVDEWEKARSELDARYGKKGGWKVSDSIRDQAKVKSTKELATEQLTLNRKQRYDEYTLKFPKILQEMEDKHLLSGVNRQTAQYKLDNILPWTAKSAQEHYNIQVLTVDKLNAAKLNGWVKSAKDGTILRDASGKLITDAAGNPIHTIGEARAKVTDIDTLVHQTLAEVSQDLTVAGIDSETQARMQALARTSLAQGMPASQIEALMGPGSSRGVFDPASYLDPTIIKRLIAVEKMRADNQRLRDKLGVAVVETVPAGTNVAQGGGAPPPNSFDTSGGFKPLSPQGLTLQPDPSDQRPWWQRATQNKGLPTKPPASGNPGDTWKSPSGANYVYGNGPKGTGWYKK